MKKRQQPARPPVGPIPTENLDRVRGAENGGTFQAQAGGG